MKHAKHIAKAIVVTVAIAMTGGAAAAPKAAGKPKRYTIATAPDALTRSVLANTLWRIDQGAVKGVDSSPTIHKNFPQIIEQNFARLDARAASAVVDSLTDKELSHLAQLYVTAATDTGRHGSPLLQLLATRVDPARLGRLSKFFGYLPTYEAVVRAAPGKAVAFEGFTTRSYAAPRYGMELTGSAGKWMNFTPTEIYLDLRTAPVGALSVSGALYEAAATLATELGIAYGVGYTAGTAANYLLQTYKPELYDTIGGTLNEMVNRLKNATDSATQGNLERSIADLFSFNDTMMDTFESTGGDYMVCEAWAELADQGRGGWPPEQDEP